MANLNERSYPKGLREIRYPSNDIIHRYTSKDYTGEISLNNETGEWSFNPPLTAEAIESGLFVKYTDLSNKFSVDPSTNAVDLDVTYVTVNDFRDSADIVPEPVPDVNLIISEQELTILEGESNSESRITIDQQPTSNVVVTITNNDPTLINVTSGDTYTFSLNPSPSEAIWNAPLYLSIRSIPDSITSNTTASLTVSVASEDARYDALSDQTITINLIDRGEAGILLTQVFQTVETQNINSFVRLASEPLDDVTITFTSNNPLVTVSPSTIVFTPQDWEARPDITYIVGEDVDTDTTVVTLNATPSSNDAAYNALPANIITVTVTERPQIADEVRIGNVIWRTFNEDWTDNGEGIYSPNNDNSNVARYGRLYSEAALERLLAANPGYRLPTKIDLLDLRESLITATVPSTGSTAFSINAETIYSNEPNVWNTIPNPTWGNVNLLTFVPSGRVVLAGELAQGFGDLGYYWHSYEGTTRAWYQASVDDRTDAPQFMRVFTIVVGQQLYAYNVRLVKDI